MLKQNMTEVKHFAGIDSFSKEEIDYRHVCIDALELFDTVGQELRKEIADEGRVLSYLADKVIDNDSSDSQFIYFVTKGIISGFHSSI